MKKNYIKPSMLAVTLQHQNCLMQNISEIAGPIPGAGEGGGLDADVKGANSHSIWDEEW